MSAIVAAVILGGGSAGAGGGTSLSIRVLNLGAVSDEDLARAYKVTRSVYEAADIDLTWVRCMVPAEPCAGPLRPGEVWIRIVPGPAAQTTGLSPLALGAASVDPNAKTGVIATVYVGQIAHLATEAEIRFDDLLGLVVSHELGHLLLGTITHTPTGLMQAGWSVSELRSGHVPQSRFSDIEAAHLRAGLARRAAPVGTGDGGELASALVVASVPR